MSESMNKETFDDNESTNTQISDSTDNNNNDERKSSSQESNSSDILSVSINFDNLCSICLNEVSVTSYADGCLHKFCGRCIFEWARRSQLCPICRTFFANIITNVLSDTEYEVIPLEDRRVPVFNFVRDSWWTNNNRNQQPSNRNIFAVRQSPRQTYNQRNTEQQGGFTGQEEHQHQHDHRLVHPILRPQPPSSSAPQMISINEQPQSEINPVIRGMNNLYLENHRSRRSPVSNNRIIWSSNRHNRHNNHNHNYNNNHNHNYNHNYNQNHNRSFFYQSQRSQQSSHPVQQSATTQSQQQPLTGHHSLSTFNMPHSNTRRYSSSGSLLPPQNSQSESITYTYSYSPATFRRYTPRNDRGHYRLSNESIPNSTPQYQHSFRPENNNHRNNNNNNNRNQQRPLRPLVGVRQDNLVSSTNIPNNNNSQNNQHQSSNRHHYNN